MISKYYLRFSLFLLFFVAYSNQIAYSASQEKVNPGTLKIVTIPVKGMVCMACVGKIKAALGSVKGVVSVNVSLKDRQAVVQYDSTNVLPKSLASKIDGLGFKAGQDWKVKAASPAEKK